LWKQYALCSPDFYPSGEELFQTHAVANYENWSDPTADQLIAATTTGSDLESQANLAKYQDYIINQVPVVWMPNVAGNPVSGGAPIVSQHIGGFSINAFSYITPETYYLTQ
jgi:peptide/nickel transport system substrate-binding protein